MSRFASPIYAPLSASAERRILDFDRSAGFGPGGTQPNRNRFYLYLTQCGSDVQIRTIAVKAKKPSDIPVIKEVVRCSVDDPWIHVLDLAIGRMSGYAVDWSPQGFLPPTYWTYGKRWETDGYALKCRWKISAPIINPELLHRTRRFRYSAWSPASGHILDYLKMYREHPEIEFLSKGGVGFFCTKVSIVKKLKADKAFRQFFCKNLEIIRKLKADSREVLRAYSKKISIEDAFREIHAEQEFRGYDLPKTVPAIKAVQYLLIHRISRLVFTDYLHNCQKAGLDLSDTKIAFPNDFQARHPVVRDMADAVRRRENAAQLAEMNRKLADIADQWRHLAGRRGEFQIVLPRSDAEFCAEGKAMSNCLGQYAAKVARGEFVVIFIRHTCSPEAAFVAAAYNPQRKEITQCYGVKNSRPAREITEIVKQIFSEKPKRKNAA